MRFLIIGASGFLGSYLLQEATKAGESFGTAFTGQQGNLLPLDIRDASATEKFIDDISPDIIFVPAAYTHVDYCEEHPEETAAINVQGVVNIVDALNKAKKPYKLVYFSTSYVFDGEKGGYKETDTPNPVNVYGKQKWEAEKYIQKKVKDYLIIRTTEIYGWEKNNKNFVARLIVDNKEEKARKIPKNLLGTPTYVANLVAVTSDLVNHREQGIFHIVGTDTVDRYSFALIIAEIFDLDKSLLTPFELDNTGKVKRPLNSGLSVEKTAAITTIPLLGVDEGLKTMKNEKQ